MRATTALIGMLIILCCSIWQQSGQTFNEFPISLIGESIQFLRTETHRVSPSIVKNGKDYIKTYSFVEKKVNVYRMTLFIKLKNDIEYYNNSFAVKLIESNGEEKIFGINVGRRNLAQEKIHKYEFETALNSTGFARIIIGQIDKSNGEFLFDKFSPSITEASLFIEEPS